MKSLVCRGRRFKQTKHYTNILAATIDDEFILYLFQIVEGLSDNADDPYHYPVIRVLVGVFLLSLVGLVADHNQLVLNEQYMVAAHDPAAAQKSGTPLINRVITVLSRHGSAYKTFGENMIYLLNREGVYELHNSHLRFPCL